MGPSFEVNPGEHAGQPSHSAADGVTGGGVGGLIVSRGNDYLKRFIAGITEDCCYAVLGIANPPLVDELVKLQLRASRTDQLFPNNGPEPFSLIGLMKQANKPEDVSPCHYRIGSTVMICFGIFPNILKHFDAPNSPDRLLNLSETAKRSFQLALEFLDFTLDPSIPCPEVLQTFMNDFELCTYALSQIQSELLCKNC